MANTTDIETIKIVVLDGYTLNPGDLSWKQLKELGEVIIFEHSTPAEILHRAMDAEIILVNKTVIDATTLEKLTRLRCICVTATGFNNVDTEAARQRDIPVCNVSGYSTASVAQHVFALLLEMTNQVNAHHASVQRGDWAKNRDFSYTLSPITELADKKMGIYGFGRIGQQVAQIALAFGMKVLATHKHPERDAMVGVAFVDLQTLFEQSDVVTLHAPMTDANVGIVNKDLLSSMKSTAYLINTARGGLINEMDLKDALKKNFIAGAGLDVLSQEPPTRDHALIGLSNCIITPHNAWASQEARQRLLDETVQNVEAFLAGELRNVVN